MRPQDSKQSGFALPTIIVIVMVLMIVGLALIQSVSSIRTSLEDQYYNRLAKEAAEAGIIAANHCLSANNFTQTWGPAVSKPSLTQSTSCTGTALTPAVTSLYKGGNIRSTFQIDDLEVRDDGAIIIASKGKIDIMRGSSSTVARSYNITMKQLVDWKMLEASKSASGTYKTCAVVTGELYCWGKNSSYNGENFSGQLGDGTTQDSTQPVKVSQQAGVLAGKFVTDVFSAQFHNCALASGKVYCWGQNDDGQLGNGTNTDSTVPVEVGGVLAGKIVTDIGGSGNTSCAIAEGKIYCWGRNDRGTVGNDLNGSADVLSPLAVSTTNLGASYTATKLSTSGSRSFNMCAIVSGKAWCWGPNEVGQVGNGTNDTSTKTSGMGANPVRVPTKVVDTGALSGKTVTAISQDGYYNGNYTSAPPTAYAHVCAVASNAVYCWGEGANGQLGRNSNSYSTVPVSVVGVMNSKVAQDIAVGLRHSCALASSHVYCWGSDSDGQLGDGNPGGSSLTPNVVAEQAGVLQGKTVTAIGGGANRGCAIADYRSYCWGRNDVGQIGDGTLIDRAVPTESIFLRPQSPAFIF